MADEHRETHTASPCPCGHTACKSWCVWPVASVQGGWALTEEQARVVARLLNEMENPIVEFHEDGRGMVTISQGEYANLKAIEREWRKGPNG